MSCQIRPAAWIIACQKTKRLRANMPKTHSVERLGMLYQLEQRQVELRGRCFVAANATVIGSVILEDQASIWFNAVRGTQ